MCGVAADEVHPSWLANFVEKQSSSTIATARREQHGGHCTHCNLLVHTTQEQSEGLQVDHPSKSIITPQ
jgi:hypothetical protein